MRTTALWPLLGLVWLVLTGLAAGSLAAQPYSLDDFLPEDADGPVYIVPISGMVDNGLVHYLGRAVDEAEDANAAVVIFHMDTFGGLVAAADEIVQTMLGADVPTVTFVDKNAASAGALIALSTDRIAMTPGASIGAATVVQGAGGEAAPDKYQSYMRGQMRATAEAKGRDPRIAEAMVDERIAIEGVTKEGEVVTLTAREAVELGMADVVLESLDDVVDALGVSNNEQVFHRATTTEAVLRFFGSPILQSLLMLMLMGGLYFELQTPGVGFPGAMAAIGGLLFFAPNYMLGYVQGWEVVLFLMGVILIIIEIFIIPGFGVAGISGLVLAIGSLVLALIGNVGFEFPEMPEITSAVVTMAVTLVLLIVLGFSLGRYMPRSQAFNRLVLQPDLGSLSGYISADTNEALVGMTGRALTTLRPAGTAEFEGERVDVVSQGDFIEPGTAVRVVRVQGSRVEVRRAEALPPPPSEAELA